MRALRFYWVVAASGAVLMALEILSIRLLSPHFGSSVYVWGSIIGTFLAALSVGYAAGGRLADRYPTLPALGLVVTASAFFLALLLLFGESLVATFARVTGNAPAGTLLTSAVLFGPATVLLGMVSPYAVRLAARDLSHLGHTAGRLYALSAVGSLAGTLGCTFLLIPYLTLDQILGLLLAVTAVTALAALAEELGRQWPATTLAATLTLLAVLHLPAGGSHPGKLYLRITPYQTLQVVEVDGIRYLQSDGVIQAGIRLADGGPGVAYTRLAPAAWLLNPEIREVLLLGLGGGNFATYLRTGRPELRFDYVEIDPAVPQVARRFLGFAEGPGDRLHVTDARTFLAGTDRRWDLILADTYIGRSVPFHLTTVEFFDLVRQRLKPGGVFAMNLAGGLGYPFPRAIYRTLAERLPTTYLFRAPRFSNLMVFATDGEVRLSSEELLARARDRDRQMSFELSLEEIVELRVEVDLELLDEPLLTDDFAPVERLIAVSPTSMPPLTAPSQDSSP